MSPDKVHERRIALESAMRNFEQNPNHVGTHAWNTLSEALMSYECTGDHDHGWGEHSRRVLPGAPCPGGDCRVFEARKLLLKSLHRSLGLG